MKATMKKKKLALARQRWKINPVTRIKESARHYSRPRARRQAQRYEQ
jgi:hypothetical protein